MMCLNVEQSDQYDRQVQLVTQKERVLEHETLHSGGGVLGSHRDVETMQQQFEHVALHPTPPDTHVECLIQEGAPLTPSQDVERATSSQADTLVLRKMPLPSAKGTRQAVPSVQQTSSSITQKHKPMFVVRSKGCSRR